MRVAHTTALLHRWPTRAAGPIGGVDGARDDHAVSVVDPDGRRLVRFTVAHTPVGLRERGDLGGAVDGWQR